MDRLIIDNITFSYEADFLFDGASLRAGAYQITGLIGSNGAGKTTLFDLVCGLKKPSTGIITCAPNHLVYLSQVLTTPPLLTMRDIALMTIALSGTENNHLGSVMRTIERWDTSLLSRYSTLLAKRSSLCSYGEKRWFFTLTLLALESEIVILDEPTAGVDPEYRYCIWACLKKAAANGAAIVISSHNIHEVSEYSDCFYMINKKKFFRFESDQQYKDFFGASSLDQAFMNAVGPSL